MFTPSKEDGVFEGVIIWWMANIRGNIFCIIKDKCLLAAIYRMMHFRWVLYMCMCWKKDILFLISNISDYQGKFGHEAIREVSEMISDIQLTDKTNTLSSKLSGGMKRKLRYMADRTLVQSMRWTVRLVWLSEGSPFAQVFATTSVTSNSPFQGSH